MELYIYIDGSDLDEIAEPIENSIRGWIANGYDKVSLVNQRDMEAVGLSEADLPDWDLGVNIKVKGKSELKEPLNFLYSLAKKYKRDFVIGIFDPQSGVAEDVCYFGREEGRPDIHEISSYLEL